MAVTTNGRVIKLAAAADAVTGAMIIQSITLVHTGAANAVVTDTAGQPLDGFQVTTSMLADHHEYPKGLPVQGIIAATLSAGILYVQLM